MEIAFTIPIWLMYTLGIILGIAIGFLAFIGLCIVFWAIKGVH